MVLSAALAAVGADGLLKPQALDKEAYPLRYSDEAARTLGFDDGQVQLLAPSRRHKGDYRPDIRAGVRHGKAGIELQWPLN